MNSQSNHYLRPTKPVSCKKVRFSSKKNNGRRMDRRPESWIINASSVRRRAERLVGQPSRQIFVVAPASAAPEFWYALFAAALRNVAATLRAGSDIHYASRRESC